MEQKSLLNTKYNKVILFVVIIGIGVFGLVFVVSAGGSGTPEDPYQITTWAELQEVNDNLTASYILMNDLGSGDTGYDTYASSSANGGAGWIPLGDNSARFTGTFDGQNYTISDLYINRPSTDYIGLFGFGYSVSISNLGIIGVNISGDQYTGSLFGYLDSTSSIIDNVFAIGNIIGKTGGYTGGLIGRNYATITNSYTNINGSGYGYVGGFIARNLGDVTKSFAFGYLNGIVSDGGFIGDSTGDTSNNFYDSTVSGYLDTEGATPKTTAQMQSIETFSAWDIVAVSQKADGFANHDYIWNIVDGSTYPFLSWEYTEDEEEKSNQIKISGGNKLSLSGDGKLTIKA